MNSPTASTTIIAKIGQENATCIHIAEAIRAQGIDDITVDFYIRSIFTFLYGSLFVLGIFGNGGVLWAVARNKRLQSARNVFLLNLIFTDLILVFTAIPVTPWYAMTKDWAFGSVMCHLVPLSNSCSVFVTSWSLTAISLDKFLHINDPTKQPVSIRQASLITFLIWIVSTLINLPYLMSFEHVKGSFYVQPGETPYCGHFCDEANWQSENSRKIYGTTVMLLQFVVPMAVITYCYFKILQKVSKDMIIQNAQFCQSLTQKQRKQEPIWLKDQPFFWAMIAHVIAMSLVVWNPVLFFWLTRKQKRSRLSKILNSTEIVSSFASRVSNSIRRSTLRSNNIDRVRKKQVILDSEGSSYTTSSRPLLIRTDLTATLSNGSTSTANRDML
uniref:G_PROTEIN_RECEP_F1_2 domain-containing protein n=1 Tax=Caenorhabditis japonica TaxID=281687 RepID=A0A8R1HV21_CAEJA